MSDTATLASIKWHIRPCPECNGTGLRIRSFTSSRATTDRSKRIATTCRACNGKGVMRQLTPFQT